MKGYGDPETFPVHVTPPWKSNEGEFAEREVEELMSEDFGQCIKWARIQASNFDSDVETFGFREAVFRNAVDYYRENKM